MRPRTFILLIAVLLVGALAVVLVIANNSEEGGLLARLDGNADTPEAIVQSSESESSEDGAEPGAPAPEPEPTPAPGYKRVIVTKVDIPVGTRITADLIEIEKRPDTNIVFQENYAIQTLEEAIGKIARFDIAQGQEIHYEMLAINATDMGDMGSDLSLYIDDNNVAIAFPVNQLSGVAYAMRPGDMIDILMTLRLVAIDPEFRTALPNLVQRLIEPELRQNGVFLIEDVTPQGRLEFIEEVGQVAEIVPSSLELIGQDFEAGSPIPKRVTQLTIQRAEVLWVGTWKTQESILEEEAANALQVAPAVTESQEGTPVEEDMAGANCISVFTGQVIPCPVIRRATTPDVVILGMSSQDALALKYAMERGLDIDLALRSQGDNSNFVTASVSLPQIIEQGGLSVPPTADFDLHPRPEDVEPPYLPPTPPEG